MFWETLVYEVRTTCLPIARMRIVVEGPNRNRTMTWETGSWPAPAADGSHPMTYRVTWRWDTRWDDGAYAPPGDYPVRFEAWDAWGRKYMEIGTLAVPVMSGPSPTPMPLPSPTATSTDGVVTPTATAISGGFVPPTPLATATSGPTPTAWLRPATATPLPPAAPVARYTGLVGQAPPWAKTVVVGVLFAGIVAALAAAYYRRKMAAWRARLNAYLLARKMAAQPRPTPPSHGEERAEQAFAENAPPSLRPDGTFDPHRGRGLWGDGRGLTNAAPDLATWKQQDDAQVESTVPVRQVSPWQQFGAWIAGIGDKIVDGATNLRQALRIRHLTFTRLEEGYVSVRAETPPGTRQAYRALVAEEGFEFYGTRYAVETVAARTARGLLRNALARGSLAVAGGVTLGQNLWRYGADPTQGATFWDRTMKNRAFRISTFRYR